MFVKSDLQGQEVLPDVYHVYHIYAIRTTNRDALQKRLLTKRVQAGVHYPIPLHLQKGFEDLGYRVGDLPHSESAVTEVLSLPMYPELS